MQVFKDNAGREWIIEIDLDARAQVKAKTDVDFLDPSAIEKLADLATLGSVLYALCEEQIQKHKLSDRDFAKGLKGDAFDRAQNALETELCDFFPNGKRQVYQKGRKKIAQMQELALAEIHKKLDGPELENKMRAMLNGPSTSSPASSESTPDPSPPAS